MELSSDAILAPMLQEISTAARFSTPQSSHIKSWFGFCMRLLTMVEINITVESPPWTCLCRRLYPPDHPDISTLRKRQQSRKVSHNGLQCDWDSLRSLRMGSFFRRACRPCPPATLKNLSHKVGWIRWLVHIHGICAYSMATCHLVARLTLFPSCLTLSPRPQTLSLFLMAGRSMRPLSLRSNKRWNKSGMSHCWWSLHRDLYSYNGLGNISHI